VLIVGIIVAVMVVLVTAALLTRRVSHDDVHSVEGYHRSLHTLEEINAHPSVSSGVGAAGAEPRARAGSAYPESAVRLAGTSTVRVTDAPPASVPPVSRPPRPPLPAGSSGASGASGADPDLPVTFDDDDHSTVPVAPRAARRRDKAMSSINHRPRRLAGPAVAVACVAVLIVVLLVTGSHSVAPPHRHAPASTTGPGRSGSHAGSGSHSGSRSHSGSGTGSGSPHRARSTSTPSSTPATTPSTQPPTVSEPQSSSASAATYQVANADFTVALSATSGPCWVDATNATTGATYFVGTLTLGQQHSFAATGPVSLVVGAPNVLAASVDGTPVQLPPGFQTPFTMNFVPMAPSAT
jgi:hypothetical protein